MPKTRREVEELLERLNHRSADELEAQDVDFKEWDRRSWRQAVRRAVDWAVCMANGGGGTVVFGVVDDMVGRDNAITGVPLEVDLGNLKLAVYDATDPKLTPVFDEIRVPEGTGRVVAMHLHPGIPPYTDMAGRGTVRIGKDCKPLTGSLRRKMFLETGENDSTAAAVGETTSKLRSAAAGEALRPDTHGQVAGPGDPERGRGLDWEAAKTRVLGLIRRRAVRGQLPLANADIRRITAFDRHRAYRLVRELVDEGQVRLDGYGRAARYRYTGSPEEQE